MSTIKTTNIQHPSAASPSIVLASTGNATYAATHDFTAATVTGAGGLRLVTPTSIANTGGSAALSGNSVTLTGVTNVSLNGVFTSTYENYQIIIKVIGSTVDNFNLRLRASGTDESGSNYRNADLGTTSTTGITSYRPGAVATVFPSPGHIEVYSPQLAVRTGFTSHVAVGASGGVTGYVVVGIHDLATAYDGFTIIAASGNITGTIRVYGYQNS